MKLDGFNTAFLCHYCLHITNYTAYHITEVKLTVMGNYKNLWVLYFTNVLKLQKL